MSQPATITLDPLSENLEASLATLPDSYGVYALRSQNAVLHLSWSAHLRRRLKRLLNPNRSSGQRLAQLLSGHAARVECWVTGSALETALYIYSLAVEFYPEDYLKRLHLRLPWFVTLTRDAFPRLIATNRPAAGASPVIGPFTSRDAASRYQEAVQSLFQIRRCVEPLQPSVEHPGCMYGEMSLCLRPCQMRVTAGEYASECERTAEFVQTNPEATLVSLSTARDRAAEQLDFEYASQLHKQIERVRSANGARPDVVRDLEGFHGVAVNQACNPGEFQLRVMLAGYWQDAVPFEVHFETSQSESLDARLRAALEHATGNPQAVGKRLEHMAIFSRWFYSSNRFGEWYPFDLRTGVPYRKIARGVSRMARQQGEA